RKRAVWGDAGSVRRSVATERPPRASDRDRPDNPPSGAAYRDFASYSSQSDPLHLVMGELLLCDRRASSFAGFALVFPKTVVEITVRCTKHARIALLLHLEE